MRIALALLVLAAPTPAAAEAPVTSWQVDAGAGIGTSEASAARAEATVEAALTREVIGPLLPRVDATGELRLAAGGDDEGLAVSHGASAILIGSFEPGDAVLPTRVSYQLDRHVRPELSSPLGLLRRTYSRAGFDWSIAFAELSGWELLRMGMGVSRVAQDLPDGTARHTQYDPHLTFFRYTRYRDDDRPPLELAIITGGGPAMAVEDGPDASVGRVDFVRMRNLALPGGLYVDGSFGVTGTGSFTTSVETNGETTWETTVETEDLPLMSVPAASLRLHGGAGPIGFAVGAARTLDLTSQVDLALDDRATATVRWQRRRSELIAEGFAARTRLWTDVETSETSLTGGGLLAYRRALGADLSVTATAEVARSFYARIDGDPTPHPELAARGALQLTRHFGGDAR